VYASSHRKYTLGKVCHSSNISLIAGDIEFWWNRRQRTWIVVHAFHGVKIGKSHVGVVGMLLQERLILRRFTIGGLGVLSMLLATAALFGLRV
jgi:hypothetical protein